MHRQFILLFFLWSPWIFAQEKPLVFATYQYADNDRIKNIKPFADHFQSVSGKQTKVVSYPSVQQLIAAMEEGEVDFAFINTFGYLLLTENNRNYSIAAALHISDTARSTYQSVIVSSKSSGMKSFEQLKANASRLNCQLVNPGSTSGNLIPRLQFAKAGITNLETAFRSVTYTKNHALTLQNISMGKADVGCFGSEEYFKALQGDSTLAEKVNLIWESSPIPLGPALFHNRLPKDLSEQFQKALLQLHHMNVGALQSIKDGWTEALPADYFQVVSDEYYRAIIRENPRDGMRIIRQFAR